MRNTADDRTHLEAKIVVRIVTVIDDCRVEPMSVLHNNIVSFSRNHRRYSLSCWIEVVEQIIHHICFK